MSSSLTPATAFGTDVDVTTSRPSFWNTLRRGTEGRVRWGLRGRTYFDAQELTAFGVARMERAFG